MSFNRATRTASVRKTFRPVPADDVRHQIQGTPTTCRSRARACPTPHLDLDQYVGLLAFIDAEGGVATLDSIARALPRVHQPVSAVFDLCDAGVLNVDWEAAFDGDMHVWRIDG